MPELKRRSARHRLTDAPIQASVWRTLMFYNPSTEIHEVRNHLQLKLVFI